MLDKRLWVVVFTVFLDLLGFGIVIPILPLYAEQMHASDRHIGVLLAIYSVMQLFFAPLWGRLSDRAGRRPILLVSILGSCLSQLGYAWAPSFVWLVVARGVAGICGANISAAQAYVADVTTERDRASGMGMLGAALGMGFVFGPALGGLLGHGRSTLPFLVAAGLSAANFVLALVFLKEARPEGFRTRARALTWAGLRTTLTAPRLWTAILLFFVVTFGFSNLEATFSLYLDRRFGYDRRAVAWLFTYIGVFIIVVQGALVRRIVPRFGEKRVLVIGTVTQALGFVGLWQAHTLAVLLVALALTSVGNALTTPSLSALISRLAGDMQGGVLGVSQSAGALARITGPLVGTTVLALGLGAPYALGAIVLAGAALIAAVVVHQPGAAATPEAAPAPESSLA
jgi:DHA1 family tetracycline resistance protein-like MFS transporter